MNKCMVMGKVKGVPKLRKVGQNDVCSFTIETSKQYKDRQTGETKVFHGRIPIEVWGVLAPVCGALAEGRKVFAEGEYNNRKYEKDGQVQWFTSIRAMNVECLDGPAPVPNQGSLGDSFGPDDTDDIPF